MTSFNSCVFTGRVGTDPDLRCLDNGTSVAKFNLAVDRLGKRNAQDKTDPMWVTVSVWGKRAQTIVDYVKKGDSILVQGELGLDEWEKGGTKNTRLTLNCSQFTFLGGRSSGGGAGRSNGNDGRSSGRSAGPAFQSRQAPQIEEDEVPF